MLSDDSRFLASSSSASTLPASAIAPFGFPDAKAFSADFIASLASDTRSTMAGSSTIVAFSKSSNAFLAFVISARASDLWSADLSVVASSNASEAFSLALT